MTSFQSQSLALLFIFIFSLTHSVYAADINAAEKKQLFVWDVAVQMVLVKRLNTPAWQGRELAKPSWKHFSRVYAQILLCRIWQPN